MSPTAPRIVSIKVPTDKIGEIIGPKGKMIQQIQEETGAEINVEEDGTVFIGSDDGESAQAAYNKIDEIAHPKVIEKGEIYTGKVVSIATFGAFVNLAPARDGLLHISKLRDYTDGERVERPEDVVAVGDEIEVEVQSVDQAGKISLCAPGHADEHNDRGGRSGGFGGGGRSRGGFGGGDRGGFGGDRGDRRGGGDYRRGGDRNGGDRRGGDRSRAPRERNWSH
jgi:polyribonucleotide nucleotidyltransferase